MRRGQPSQATGTARGRASCSSGLAACVSREADIGARVIDQSYRQEPLPLVRSFAVVLVLVKAEQADEARRLLQERRELPEDAFSEEP